MSGYKDRFGELDFIRFFAAFIVLVYHYQAKYIESPIDPSALAMQLYDVTKFGYLGVELFFIISGFVIFGSALDRTSFQFFVSRTTRIYPTFWVCLSITALIVLCFGGPLNQVTLTQWFANLTLFNSKLGHEAIDGVYWTLVIEIKFYLFVFILLACNLFKYYKVWISLWLAVTLCYLFTNQPFFLRWFVSPDYASYFIAGMVFFLARKEGYTLFHVVVLVLSLFVSSVYATRVIGEFVLHNGISIQDKTIAIVIIGSFYLTFFLISIRQLTVPVTAIGLAFGGITYPLYLLHNRAGKTLYDFFSKATPKPFLLIAIALLMIMLSLLIHIYLEKKISNRLKTTLFSMHGKVQRLRRLKSGDVVE